MNKNKLWRRANSSLLILGVLIIVLLVNLLAGKLLGGVQLDLTREGYFSLSDTTRSLLGRTKIPVEIAILAEESSTDPHLTELLSMYEKEGKTVTVTYVDPIRDPAYAQKLPPDVANRLQSGSVWVTAEGRYRVLSSSDLISYNNYGELKSIDAEQCLTSAIAYVAEPSDDTVTFVGIETDGMVSLFENENYNVDSMESLRVGELNENTRALIFIAPQNDLSAEEVARLEAFLNDGGRVAFFFGADSTAEQPLLDDFLYKWNIKLNRNMIIDLEHCVNQTPNFILGTAESERLEGANDGAVLMLPQAQSINVLADQSNSYVDTEIYATTYESAMTASGKGIYPVIACSKKYRGTEVAGKVLVSGSYLMLHDDIMSDSAYSNSSFVNNIMRDLLDRKDSVNIPNKVAKTSTVPMSNSTFWILTVLVIVVIPFLIALWGILSYRKRRYL